MTIDIQLTLLHHPAPRPTDEDHGEPTHTDHRTQGTTRTDPASSRASHFDSSKTPVQNQALAAWQPAEAEQKPSTSLSSHHLMRQLTHIHRQHHTSVIAPIEHHTDLTLQVPDLNCLLNIPWRIDHIALIEPIKNELQKSTHNTPYSTDGRSVRAIVQIPPAIQRIRPSLYAADTVSTSLSISRPRFVRNFSHSSSSATRVEGWTEIVARSRQRDSCITGFPPSTGVLPADTELVLIRLLCHTPF